MKRENDEIAELFQSRLKRCELPVRDNFWEELEKDLPARPMRRFRLMPFRYAAIAAVFLAVIGLSATLWLFAPKEEIEEAFTQVAATSGQIRLPGRDDAPQEMMAVIPRPVSPQSVLPKIPATSEYADDSVSVSFSFTFSLSSDLDDRPDELPHEGILAANGSLDPDEVQQNKKEFFEKKRKGWAVGVHALAATSGMGKAGGFDYKMPVSVGVSVRKQLTNRFALETGLNYTMLRSKALEEKNPMMVQDRKLHYLGIPLKASYTVLDKKNVDLYLTGGGLVEKCVGTGKDSGIQCPKHVQYALTASAGVQYKIGKNVAVFAEPGVAYNFDSGVSTPEIRKEKPLNFNLLCGVRVMY